MRTDNVCFSQTFQEAHSVLYETLFMVLDRGVKSTWKPYLSKSTDTLQWKLLHYKLQVTNYKTTRVKVLEYLILTVLNYFTYTKYRLRETFQSKTVTLWRSWGKQAEARIYVQGFHGKTRTSNKPTTKWNKEQNDGETDNHYIQQLTKN